MVSRHQVGKKSYDKGKQFESDMLESWKCVPSWRIRLRDGGGGETPADDLVLLDELRVLAEYKCTDNDKFNFSSAVKQHQIDAALTFESACGKNVGVLFINFRHRNAVVIIRIIDLLTYYVKANKKSIDFNNLDDIKHIRISRLGLIWNLRNIEEKLKHAYSFK